MGVVGGRSAKAGTMCTEPRRRLLALRGPRGWGSVGAAPLTAGPRSLGGPFPKLAERLPPRSRAWASRGRLGGAHWNELSQPLCPAPLPGSGSWTCGPGTRACRVGNLIQNGCWDRLGFILSKCYQFLRPDKLNRPSDTAPWRRASNFGALRGRGGEQSPGWGAGGRKKSR